MSALPVLYSFRRCPYAIRARLALSVAGQSCTLREVVLRNKPQALLEASAKATVPVLVLASGQVIDESLDIMLWALRQHDPESWLSPQLGDEPAMLALIAECDQHFKHHLDRYKYPQRFDLSDGTENRQQAALWLQKLDARLQKQPYLFGQQAALADMAILPFVRQFAHTDRDWFFAQNWPALARWLSTWLESDRFKAVMQKYEAWEPNSEPIVFA